MSKQRYRQNLKGEMLLDIGGPTVDELHDSKSLGKLEQIEPSLPKKGEPPSITALWLADPPTWALERLHLEIPTSTPVLAVSGERVVGSNHLARKAGIKPSESLSRSLQLCPQAQVYIHDDPAMLAAWDSAIAAAYSFSPWVEPTQLGLLFVGGLNPQEATDLAKATQARVGQASSRSTAQLAALTVKEGSARAIPHETSFIAQIPTRYLLGLGFAEEMIARLHLFGVAHLADLHRLNLTQKQLEAQFKTEGKRLYQIAHAHLTQPIQRFQEPLVAHKRWEFEEPVVEPHQFIPILQLLVAQAALELENKVCWVVTVLIQSKRGKRLRRRVMGAATNSPKALLTVAELTFWDAHVGGSEVEALEVTLSRIAPSLGRQQDLFGVFQRPPVWDALERVDARFNGSIGRIDLKPHSRFREESWRFVALGPSQQNQVGVGRRVR